MARPRKIEDHEGAQAGTESLADEQALGEQLMRQARQGHADFLAGWTDFMKHLGIQGKPVGAKKLRQMLLQSGINPKTDEFSQGIISMREE